MLEIELIRAEPQHAPGLARICFEAFKAIHDRHGFPRDIPNIALANTLLAMLTSRSDVYGVAARVNNRLAGSNFISLTDSVGGVGPITVDPAFEGYGIGRKLMQGVLDHADRTGMQQVRLLQDAFNTKSLSLYASLDFTARAPIGLMNAWPAPAPDQSVRRACQADVPALDELCQRVFKVSRRGEITAALQSNFPIFLRERQGRIAAYSIAGFIGHGAGETAADALAVIGEAARQMPPETALFFCPLTSGDFFRAALQAGHRLRKIMTYMTRGPFAQPEEIWMPSIAY